MTAFQNKVIWITGASSGYGKALALAFDKAGAKVVLSARRHDKLQQLAATMKQAKVVDLDLTQSNTFIEKTQAAIAAFGHIDILIHNGAVGQSGSALATQDHVARQIMDVNYFSYTELTRCILPHFIQRNSGQLVVISGLIANVTLPNRSTYAASKIALLGYFGCLRAELVNNNIDVTILIPGMMQTEFVNSALTAEGGINHKMAASGGCTVDEAAKQSLVAIEQKKYQSYIGLKDDSYQLWRLFHHNPTAGIDLLLNKFRQ